MVDRGPRSRGEPVESPADPDEIDIFSGGQPIDPTAGPLVESIVPVDWIPFEERDEFRQAMRALEVYQDSGVDDSSHLPMVPRHSSSLRERGGGDAIRMQRQRQEELQRLDPERRVKRLQDAMVNLLSGSMTEADILTNYGEETFAELTPDIEGGRGYIQSGYKFQSLNPNSIGTDTFLNATTKVSLNIFDDMSLYEINSAFLGLKPSQQMSLKATLYQAGYYEQGSPDYDGLSQSDMAAFESFTTDNLLNPDKTLEGLMSDRIEERYLRRRGEYGSLSSSEHARESQRQSGRTIMLSDPEVMKDNLREFAQSEFGSSVNEDQIDFYVQRASAAERANKESFYASQDAQIDREMNQSVEEIDLILDAISGPMDQPLIHSNEWSMWSRRAGLDPFAEMSPDNVRQVGRFLFSDFYDQTGNISDALGLWYSSAGRGGTNVGVQHPLEDMTSVRDFQKRTMENMVQLERERFGASGSAGGGGGNRYVYDFDPNAAAARELRAANLAKSQTWEYANRADQFFNLLARGANI